MSQTSSDDRPERPAGAEARHAAVAAVRAVLSRGATVDAAMAEAIDATELSSRDRGFARLVTLATLRRRGSIGDVLSEQMPKGMPKSTGPFEAILLTAVAQLAILGTPAHAAINAAVAHCQRHRRTQPYASLANAVLRRIAPDAAERLARRHPADHDVPAWLMTRWRSAYGDTVAREIAAASVTPAALDLTVKQDPDTWAERLGGTVLPTGSVRLEPAGRIDDLAGYKDGEWWVQDAAAALPARLLGPIAGLCVLDLCAAPGGKTAQLAQAGAQVTALDLSRDRLEIVAANLARLGLDAQCVAADATRWTPPRLYDAVLLDAPCSATGTIRRHPDILVNRTEEDVARAVELQRRLIRRAVDLVRPGGVVVYCTCSLEPAEGEDIIAELLAEDDRLERRPIAVGEAGIDPAWLTATGDLRLLPTHIPVPNPWRSGVDGFYAGRLVRRGSA